MDENNMLLLQKRNICQGGDFSSKRPTAYLYLYKKKIIVTIALFYHFFY